MKTSFFILICLASSLIGYSQRYQLASSQVSFYSSAPLEDIEAKTTEGKSIFNASTGEVAFIIPIKSFEFDRALMEEHFNENYLESDKYPNATFEGELQDFNADETGKQTVAAKGQMTIHGVSQSLKIEGKIQPQGEGWEMNATFPIKVADYKIDIPKVVFYNIAEVVDVTVHFTYQSDAQP